MVVPGLENLPVGARCIHIDYEIAAGEKVSRETKAHLLSALIQEASREFDIFNAELREIYWQSPYHAWKDMLTLAYISA
jgi:hypothetical protein